VSLVKRIRDQTANLEDRKAVCWSMARVFLDNRDSHGLHDMGVEIQALDRALAELKSVAEGLSP
jgi:hypothetical protein